jgi:hypothetical protein
MNPTTDITFCVSPTNSGAGLGFEAWLDNTMMFDVDNVQQSTQVSIPVADNDAEHVLKLVLKGKCAEHTTVDSDGKILSDSLLTISDLAFDGIILGQIVYDNTVYTHDFNGTGNTIEDQFFGAMGCNGTVTLKFTTPVYIWLLENM